MTTLEVVYCCPGGAGHASILFPEAPETPAPPPLFRDLVENTELSRSYQALTFSSGHMRCRHCGRDLLEFVLDEPEILAWGS